MAPKAFYFFHCLSNYQWEETFKKTMNDDLKVASEKIRITCTFGFKKWLKRGVGEEQSQ